jgi:hypothetical protein
MDTQGFLCSKADLNFFRTPRAHAHTRLVEQMALRQLELEWVLAVVGEQVLT